jgi:hypothetical protein
MATTKHTCGGPVFGKRTAGCPRCEELSAGARPIQWKGSRAKAADAERSRAILAHSCKAAGCGPVCTFGDW